MRLAEREREGPFSANREGCEVTNMSFGRQTSTVLLGVCLSLASGCELFAREPSAPPPTESVVVVEPVVSAAPPPVEPKNDAQAPAPAEAPPPPPGVEASPGPTRGQLPKAALNDGIQAAMPKFTACYAKAAQRHPELRGRILVNFVVAEDGSVPYAASLEQGTDLPNNHVIDCVLRAFQSLHFPAPQGGRAVVTYPLTFEPAPDAPADAQPAAP
jgi:hypothetical protein